MTKQITLPCYVGDNVLVKIGYYSQKWIEEVVKRVTYSTDGDVIKVYTESGSFIWGRSARGLEGEG